MKKQTRIEAAVKRLLTSLDVDVKDENYRDTPKRYAEWIAEHFTSDAEFNASLQSLAKSKFPSKYNGLVAQTNIVANGICPHHLLPVKYKVAVGYLPTGMDIGLSKLTRITQLCLARAGLQEDLTQVLATSLQTALETEDVAVIVRGEHMCMVCRGVKAVDSETITSSMMGRFIRDDKHARSEFLLLTHGG